MKKRMALKIGGRAFESDEAFKGVAKTVLENPDALELVIVHGGGAQISAALQAAGRPTEFIDGIRKTQKEDMDIIERVLSVDVNGHIISKLTEYGVVCQPLSGKNGHLLIAEQWFPQGKDVGCVGKIITVQPTVIEVVLLENKVPVVSPVSADRDGHTYNINADDAAVAIAIGTRCTDLVYFTDVPGVKDDTGAVVAQLTVNEANEWIEKGVIAGGMVAKVHSIADALQKGVERVHVTTWQTDTTLSDILWDKKGLVKTTITL